MGSLELSLKVRRSHQARRLRDLLRSAIRDGAWRQGPLPSEHELAKQFGVSRNAVRDALDQLRSEGVVERIPGQGTFSVCSQSFHHLQGRVGLRDSLGERVGFELLALDVVGASPHLAEHLSVPRDSPLTFVERRNLVNGLPSSVTSSYIVRERLDDDLSTHQSEEIPEVLSRSEYYSAEMSIEALPCGQGSAEMLDVPLGSPLLFAVRTTRRPDGAPVELSFIHGRTDRLAVSLSIP